jgi:hypothetical protein
MSVPDNMKIVLLLLLLLLPCAAIAQQDGYELDAWFWHRHLSTHDSLFTQDYDNKSYKASIPVHLKLDDFKYLDSVAEAIDLWSYADTVATQFHTGRYIEISISSEGGPETMDIYFKTPRHPLPKAGVAWPGSDIGKISQFVRAIRRVLKRQPNYYELPDPKARY